MDNLAQKIFESLDNAIENGYELHNLPAEEIAEDLAEYDSQFEGVDTAELIPHIQDWLNK